MNGKEMVEEIKNPDPFALIRAIPIAQEEKRIEERKRKMIEKVELANDLLVVLKSASTQDQIDILQLALDSMLAKKQLNNSDALAQMEKEEPVTDLWYVRSESEVELVYRIERPRTGFFSCTCPDFQIRHRDCEHIKKVKTKLVGEKQKNKLPGAI